MDPWQAFNFDWKLETNIDATKSMAGVVKKKMRNWQEARWLVQK